MREAQRGGGRRLTEAALLKHLLMGIGGWQTHIKRGGRRLTEAALLKHLLMGIGGWQTHIKLVSDLPPAPYGTASVSSRSR